MNENNNENNMQNTLTGVLTEQAVNEAANENVQVAPVQEAQAPVVETPVVQEETKEEKKKKEKNPVVRVLEVLIILLFLVWAFMLYHDYDNVKASKKPDFCFFGEDEEKLDLGTITTYKCIGYKVVKYKTEDASMTEFSALWQGNRKLEDINK